MATEPRSGLTLHVQGDAQPEVVANGFNYVLAFLAAPLVKSRTTTAPPGSPTLGDAYIVPASATGAWSGWTAGTLTVWIGYWHNFAAPEGLAVFVQDEELLRLLRLNSTWAVPDLALDTALGQVWTGRRYGSTDIDQKAIAFGALPNATTKSVAHGISSLDLSKPIRVHVFELGATAVTPIPATIGGSVKEVSVDATNVNIFSDLDLSSLTALVVLEFCES